MKILRAFTIDDAIRAGIKLDPEHERYALFLGHKNGKAVFLPVAGSGDAISMGVKKSWGKMRFRAIPFVSALDRDKKAIFVLIKKGQDTQIAGDLNWRTNQRRKFPGKIVAEGSAYVAAIVPKGAIFSIWEEYYSRKDYVWNGNRIYTGTWKVG